MNEEEKKAIEKVKEIIYNPEFRNIILCDSEGFTGWNNNFETILNLIEKQQQKIEELDKENTRQQELIGNIHQKWKDKIKEKINLIDKEYADFIEENQNDLYLVNINAQRHSAMQTILEELLGE